MIQRLFNLVPTLLQRQGVASRRAHFGLPREDFVWNDPGQCFPHQEPAIARPEQLLKWNAGEKFNEILIEIGLALLDRRGRGESQIVRECHQSLRRVARTRTPEPNSGQILQLARTDAVLPCKLAVNPGLDLTACRKSRPNT